MSTDRHPMTRRIRLGAAAVIALIIATTGAAQAEGNAHRVPVHNTPIDLPADICGFPIHLGVVYDREWVEQTDNPDGSTTMRVAGPLINSLTNMNTGATITYDNGGPGTLTRYPDGHVTFDFRGHSMAWIRAEHQARLAKPALRLTVGHVVGTQDTSGNIVELSSTGRTVDGCALLSGHR